MREQDKYIDEVYKYYKEMKHKQNERVNNPKYEKIFRMKLIIEKCVKIFLLLGIFAIIFITTAKIKETIDLLNGNNFAVYDVITQLRNEYNGKFKIISKTSSSNSSDGEFKVMDQNNIVFTTYKTGGSNTNDYVDYLIQNWFLEYIEKKPNDKFVYSGDYENNESGLFKFTFGEKIEKYYEIDQAVKDLVRLNEYIGKKFNKVVKGKERTWKTCLFINSYTCTIKESDKNNVDSCIYKAKLDYVEYLHDNNLKDRYMLNGEFEKMYKPAKVKIYINGAETQVFASYDYEKMTYKVYFEELAEMIPTIDSITKSKDGSIHSITYNGIEMLFDKNVREVKKNKLPYLWELQLFEDLLNAEVELNYDEKKVYLVFK